MEFQCKEFSLNHSKSSMKIGTDAIVLSSLAPDITPSKVLDIGTGCGIIALCMAQKYPLSEITAIDIDLNSIQEARNNFSKSKFNSRLIAKEIDLLLFSKDRIENFDLIITNPPFFISSLESPLQNRTKARHTSSLTYDTLIQASQCLLSKEGLLCIILPNKESEIFIEKAENSKFEVIKRINIYSKPNKECERVVLYLKEQDNNIAQEKLSYCEDQIIILRNNDNTYSQEYLDLVKSYLL
ncbi:MAG: methyltransferase [Bacteroidales bacterium]|nr:methyltransferase [Bacteroidales bacterium]